MDVVAPRTFMHGKMVPYSNYSMIGSTWAISKMKRKLLAWFNLADCPSHVLAMSFGLPLFEL